MGTTEAFALFLSNDPSDPHCDTTGKVVEGFELKITDENGHEVPRGEIGDLFVKGETFSLFYLHQYHKTQQYFRGEWLYTGDKFYVDEEGFYHYAGRFDDMLKVGGIWVSPVEIENTLRTHQAVYECCVMGYPDRDAFADPADRGHFVAHGGFHGRLDRAQQKRTGDLSLKQGVAGLSCKTSRRSPPTRARPGESFSPMSSARASPWGRSETCWRRP